jgi:hypothetical protein
MTELPESALLGILMDVEGNPVRKVGLAPRRARNRALALAALAFVFALVLL